MSSTDKKKKAGTFGCSHCGSRHDIPPDGQLRCPLAEDSVVEVHNIDDESSNDPDDYGPPGSIDEGAPSGTQPASVLFN